VGAGKDKTAVMAERRMFNKSIIDSDLFLDMPLSTQALYFHLAMRADDEGFVDNPRKIMRMIGSEEDSLRLLTAKQFIIPFDSGVVVIRHWKLHNYIQKDRYHDTIYQNEKAMLTTDKSGVYITSDTGCVQLVNKLDTNCIQSVSRFDTSCVQDDNNLDTTCTQNVRVGKVSIGKYSIDNNNARARAEEPADKIPYKQIMDLYHAICISYPKIRGIDGERKKAVSARYKANPNMEVFKRLFEKAEASKFLQGNNDRHWKADFDFLMNASRFNKVLEGKYDDVEQKPQEQAVKSYDISEVESLQMQKYRNLGSGGIS
jgi:hypothetical protein